MNVPKTYTDKVFSYILTRLCWRDLDIVEDSHASESINCNPQFFNEIHKAVTDALNKWIPKIHTEVECQRIYNKIQDPLINDTVQWLFYQHPNWDTPVIVHERYKHNLTDFLLNGEFRKACDTNLELNDTTMSLLNHDIHNRMFTLMRRNHISI